MTAALDGAMMGGMTAQPITIGTTIHDEEVTVASAGPRWAVLLDGHLGRRAMHPDLTSATDAALSLVPVHRRTSEGDSRALASALAIIGTMSEALRDGAARLSLVMPLGGPDDADTLAVTIMLQAADGLDAIAGMESLDMGVATEVREVLTTRHLTLVDL